MQLGIYNVHLCGPGIFNLVKCSNLKKEEVFPVNRQCPERKRPMVSLGIRRWRTLCQECTSFPQPSQWASKCSCGTQDVNWPARGHLSMKVRTWAPHPRLEISRLHAYTMLVALRVCTVVSNSLPPHGREIVQARILEWVAISASRGSSWPSHLTGISCTSCIGRWILYH